MHRKKKQNVELMKCASACFALVVVADDPYSHCKMADLRARNSLY